MNLLLFQGSDNLISSSDLSEVLREWSNFFQCEDKLLKT